MAALGREGQVTWIGQGMNRGGAADHYFGALHQQGGDAYLDQHENDHAPDCPAIPLAPSVPEYSCIYGVKAEICRVGHHLHGGGEIRRLLANRFEMNRQFLIGAHGQPQVRYNDYQRGQTNNEMTPGVSIQGV